MEADRAEQLIRLRLLADDLTGRGLSARLAGPAGRTCLKVARQDDPQLNEQVLCQPGADGSWWFWWPSRQPIGPADDIAAVAARIVTALRPVGGTS